MRSDWKLSLLLIGAFVAPAFVQAGDSGRPQVSLTTREHLEHEAWWPTKQFRDQSQFEGTKSCADCHAGLVRTQSTSQMALTMMPAANAPVLATHTGPIFTFGSYTYAVEKTAGAFALKVSDGSRQRTEPLQWAIGSGVFGQSYGWWQDGQMYESRFNYFAGLHGFDQTPGRMQGVPISLDMAQGRKLAEFEARKCFACHSTALTTTEPLQSAAFYPGITCEACHGPGRDHLAAVLSHSSDLDIVNPARLTPVRAVDFCGACHGTPRDVELMGMLGRVTVRFPAYRLEKSRCWGTAGDARLTCFACHDPHRPLQREAAAYDAACLRCHAGGPAGVKRAAARQPACPVAQSRCTSCHMQKVSVAGMHYNFTDHDIRIVKANAAFPD